MQKAGKSYRDSSIYRIANNLLTRLVIILFSPSEKGNQDNQEIPFYIRFICLLSWVFFPLLTPFLILNYLWSTPVLPLLLPVSIVFGLNNYGLFQYLGEKSWNIMLVGVACTVLEIIIGIFAWHWAGGIAANLLDIRSLVLILMSVFTVIAPYEFLKIWGLNKLKSKIIK